MQAVSSQVITALVSQESNLGIRIQEPAKEVVRFRALSPDIGEQKDHGAGEEVGKVAAGPTHIKTVPAHLPCRLLPGLTPCVLRGFRASCSEDRAMRTDWSQIMSQSLPENIHFTFSVSFGRSG
ncbi:unnamed protein product [Ostreobium quekettii]|uniref:Uncharacterized protein n=1 Tax=Ostreobium quekettii TaxID=121088 RepID=A0A8S1J3U5_9CHLO|nr:unnamed protein product [Ostreobium quekettii]